ncbi:MAG: TIGR00159 family protein [Microcystis wesenbergii Mw_MB_S_20031200_S109]|uniref:Diadenylate cyclase n=1 Tax=Microcystis wesenbergii Mw_MB_S_20031200_S109D TaxID=2486241 RepID=A0A552M528_9CHRO|nr:MAG: TIGR00159 family protein [Microcystis wesenbergii Mw_MB_S_20031200_S109]TRV27559.1 MAG: TIGR00159 family protein [Microcystis wesenbergii Mw_MB_S_20031200_S109D]
MSGFFLDPRRLLSWILSHGLSFLDFGLVLLLTYMLLLIIGERRTFWMVRGLIYLMLASVISDALGLRLLGLVLEKLILGAAVAIAVIFQSEFRRFLELLGKGQVWELFQKSSPTPKTDNVIDELVDAVKDLSQNRTGALMVLETSGNLDTKVFVNPGVMLNGEVSKELIQTIFQTKTLLHDGAVFIRGDRVVAAGVILPLSERSTSRQLGTRHRAAMGITERLDNCICIVVSEETGSISLASGGNLDRPLTSSKLKELLEAKFSPSGEGEVVAPSWGRLGRTIGLKGRLILEKFSRSPSATPKDRK